MWWSASEMLCFYLLTTRKAWKRSGNRHVRRDRPWQKGPWSSQFSLCLHSFPNTASWLVWNKNFTSRSTSTKTWTQTTHSHTVLRATWHTHTWTQVSTLQPHVYMFHIQAQCMALWAVRWCLRIWAMSWGEHHSMSFSQRFMRGRL